MPPLAGRQGDAGWHVSPSSPRPTLVSRLKSQSCEPLPRTKSVAFCDVDEIIVTHYPSDMVKNSSSLWYKEEDYERIKKEWSDTLKKYSDRKPILEDSGYCMRGLEAKTKFGCRRRRNFRSKALNAVWETQIAQWRRKVDDQMEISTAYRAHTIHCRYRAIEAAYHDELYVKRCIL